jgi:hypothetical protein
VATFTERLELLISGSSTSAVTALTKTSAASEELTAKQKAMQLVSGGASKALENMGVSAENTGAAMTTAGVAAGAVVSVKVAQWAKGAADEWANLAGEVRTFQRASGASAEDSSRWIAALDDLGVSAEAGSKAAFKLGKEAATGGDNLAKFGVEIKKNHDGTTDLTGTLLNVADAYAATEDPAQRAALATAAFGKAGKDLAPILERGSAGLKEFFAGADEDHQLFSQADLERAREYDLALNNLSDSFRGLKLEVGAAAAPTITKFANALTTGVHGFDLAANAAGGLGTTFAKSALQSTPLIGSLLTATDALGTIGDALGLAGDDSVTYADKQNAVKDALQKVLDLQADGKGHTKEYADAVKAAGTAQDSFEASTRKATDALTDNAVAQYNASAGYLASAAAGVDLQSKVLNVNDALDKENKLLADGQTDAQTAEQYQNDLAQAHVNTENAVLGVIAASAAKAQADAGPNATNTQIATDKLNAQNDAVLALWNNVPQTRQALTDLGYSVTTLPDGKQIVVTADTSQAVAAIQSVIDAVERLTQHAGDAVRNGFGLTTRSAPGTQLVPAAAPAPAALGAAPAAVMARAAVPVYTFHVNVSTRGLGADAPEIQRAVVDALRGYVTRNGRLENVTR